MEPVTSPPPSDPLAAGKTFRRNFVLILLVITSGLFLAVAWPLLEALFLGALLTGLCQPLYRAILRRVRGHRAIAAALTLLAVFVLIVGPLGLLLGLVVQQAMTVSEFAIPWAQKLLQSAGPSDVRLWLMDRLPWMQTLLPNEEEIARSAGEAAQSLGRFVFSGISAFTAGTAGLLLQLFVMLYAMFFFLKDGDRLLEKILDHLPLGDEDEESMMERFASVTRATVKGTLLIGLIQGTLGGLALWAAGIPGAAFWGAVMVVLSVVPGIGAPLVWGPAVIYLYLNDQFVTATLLLVWGAGVVGTVDNLLRPPLVGRDARMPDLLILVGTLGGLFLFGPVGFITGPIICGLFLTTLDIYASAFRRMLGSAKRSA